jgi:hypothetical protein
MQECSQISTRDNSAHQRSSAPRNGLIQPLLQTDLAESRVTRRNQRTLTEFGPEVARVGVGHNLAGIVALAQDMTDQLIETELFGAMGL